MEMPLKRAAKPEDQDDPQQGLELFLELYDIWVAKTPAALRAEDPRFLSSFLRLCDSAEGISQANLRKALKVDQPRISRLAKRLKKLGIVRDDIPLTDGRIRLTKLTPEGHELVRRLWADLKGMRLNFRSAIEKAKDDAESWDGW
jgi:DNA-binding MarR family transcriptional regulator